MIDRKNKLTMVALTLGESSIAKLIEAVEWRAILRCPNYDSNNQYWKQIDGLLYEKDNLMGNICSFNNNS